MSDAEYIGHDLSARKAKKMSERPYQGDITDCREIAALPPGTIYNRLWQPFVAAWAPRHLVAAYGLHLRGKVDMGDIVASISKDDGDTWSPAVPVFVHSSVGGARRVAYANPVLFKPPGQEIVWCFAMRCPLHYRDSEESELCGAYSADGGWSWQQVELAIHHHGPLITCAGIVTVTDELCTRYLLPVHSNSIRHDPRGVQDQFVLESTSLLEWKLAAYVPRPDWVFPHEGNISVDPTTGKLRMVMRTATAGRSYEALDPPRAFATESIDGGRSWSKAIEEPALYNAASKAFYGHGANGTEIYVYSPGARGERKSLRYRVRRPGEADWGEDRLFYDGDNRNSYPTLIELEPTQFAAVWDSSNDAGTKRTSIRFGRLSV